MSIFGTFLESFEKFANSTTLQENTHIMNSGHYPDSFLTLQLYEEKNCQCKFFGFYRKVLENWPTLQENTHTGWFLMIDIKFGVIANL